MVIWVCSEVVIWMHIPKCVPWLPGMDLRSFEYDLPHKIVLTNEVAVPHRHHQTIMRVNVVAARAVSKRKSNVANFMQMHTAIHWSTYNLNSSYHTGLRVCLHMRVVYRWCFNSNTQYGSALPIMSFLAKLRPSCTAAKSEHRNK